MSDDGQSLDETEHPSQTEGAVEVVIEVGTADAAAEVREAIASAGVRESAIEIREEGGDCDV